jgi:hypothetical protein
VSDLVRAIDLREIPTRKKLADREGDKRCARQGEASTAGVKAAWLRAVYVGVVVCRREQLQALGIWKGSRVAPERQRQ